VPDATVSLHVRELTWLVDPKAPRLIQHTIVVTQPSAHSCSVASTTRQRIRLDEGDRMTND
jgi:hypothetical protein